MKFKYFLIAATLPVLFFAATACDDDDDDKVVIEQSDTTKTVMPENDGTVSYLTVTVKVNYPEEFKTVDAALLNGRTVKLAGTEATLTAETDEKGVATFSQVIPGEYSVSTSWTITAADYTAATGEQVSNNKYTVSGTLASEIISENAEKSINLIVSQKSALLIGKVYNEGRKYTNEDGKSTNFDNGKYIEIFNNSDEDVEVAGLYIGLVESNSTVAYKLGVDPKNIYMKQIFRIPEGTPALAPSKTLLIVNSAFNYTEYEDQDLSGADLEAKDTESKKPIQNNEATKALTSVYTYSSTLKYMNLVQGGPCGVAIFSSDYDFEANLDQDVYADGKTSGNKQFPVPVETIIDAIEILKYKSDGSVDLEQKRFYDYIDAGEQHSDAVSGRSGIVYVRKVDKEATKEAGRTILVDTNNSSNDFTASKTATIREY